MEELYLLPCSLAPVYISYTIQVHLPRDGANYSVLGPSASINNQDSLPRDAQRPIWTWQFLHEGYSSHDSRVCQVDKANQDTDSTDAGVWHMSKREIHLPKISFLNRESILTWLPLYPLHF